ncbi:MAG: hypothetical protein QOJ11_4186 [Frankiales bacterium]|jgi:hypothetical protein|nr:hypothetical protein [Frankiales bacterium]
MSPRYRAGMTHSARDDSGKAREDHEAAAPRLGPATDIYLGDETMELLAYGDVEGAKARHDGSPKPVKPPAETAQD